MVFPSFEYMNMASFSTEITACVLVGVGQTILNVQFRRIWDSYLVHPQLTVYSIS